MESEIFSCVERCLLRLREVRPSASPPSLLLAVSGGLDSSVLLDIFTNPNHSLPVTVSGVVHVNHNLRAESASDEEFVRKISEAKKLPFFCKIGNPPDTGIESWGRYVRYEFFNEVRLQTGADFVVTAHHLDDEIETFLFRLITGRAVANEHGLIREIDPDRKVLRPFLSVSKHELTAYAQANGVSFVEDSTNSDTLYTRNFIRHKVLSLFEEVNPSARKSLDDFIKKSCAEELYLEESAFTYSKKGDVSFNLIPEILRTRVLRIIAGEDIGVTASCISNRRYLALSEMLLSKPSEVKHIDMGQKITAVVDKRMGKVIPLRFIRN